MDVDLFRVEGARAIVTGAASGIGRACADMLTAAGASVLSLDRAGGDGVVSCDVTDEAAIDSVIQEHGPPEILICSAGTAIRGPATELSRTDWERVVDVNLTGTFLCARAAARQLISRKRPGSIVFIASIMGLSGGGLYPNVSYQASKGAVVNMTRALAVEWAGAGIRVNAVAPTYVRTPFIAPLLAQPDLVARIEAMTPLGRLAEPRDVAAAALFLGSPAAAMVTGHILAVDGGFLAQ